MLCDHPFQIEAEERLECPTLKSPSAQSGLDHHLQIDSFVGLYATTQQRLLQLRKPSKTQMQRSSELPASSLRVLPFASGSPLSCRLLVSTHTFQRERIPYVNANVQYPIRGETAQRGARSRGPPGPLRASAHPIAAQSVELSPKFTIATIQRTKATFR